MNERNLFTNHGLHRNKQGKNLINKQLVQLLFTIFNHNHNAVHPIPLGWYEIPNESNLIRVESFLKSIIKPTNRNTQ